MVRSSNSNLHIFGIRHHGPGSARSLRDALETLQPDCILVEGPPDAAGVLPLLGHPEMKPPVALLIYRPDEPRRAVYYPFAVFSPEWQALHYGLTHGATVRFMDLPQAHYLARRLPGEEPPDKPAPTPEQPSSDEQQPAESEPEIQTSESQIQNPREDPLRWLAEAAGYSDGERWWEHMVEQRRSSADVFAAIMEAMTVLRQEFPTPDDAEEATREARREAHMRQSIRAAQRDGFERIAVVCGAWHAPALGGRLKSTPAAREDTATLKDLPKVKVQATWVPWTHGRLSYYTGYGAGIESPGWYHHLWTNPGDVPITWMVKVAQLLREEDLDASSAHVIEAVRTAEALAAIRERPAVGLPELNEATRAVLLFGSDLPMRLIHDKLIVGEMLGSVPDETPMVPLQIDLNKEQKRLRLPPEAAARSLDLDLRNGTDLERSHLLHRLNLLGIPWGRTERAHGKKGTFHELWKIQWQPELAVTLIEAGAWGNTIEDAATARVRDAAGKAATLPELTRLVDGALLASLSEAIPGLMTRFQEMAALTSDVPHLMDSLPPMANVLRYGNVRRTDTSMVAHVVDGIVARICIGLPGSVASLNDEAAAEMFDRLMTTNEAIGLLQNGRYSDEWYQALRKLADQQGAHGLVSGRACRILLDAGRLAEDESARYMGRALSRASDPPQAAAWVEGFLKGSGLVLLHDRALMSVVDSWVTGLQHENFESLLPLLRRTFSTFTAPERRQIGEWVRRGPVQAQPASQAPANFDQRHAEAMLPLLAKILGLRAD